MLTLTSPIETPLHRLPAGPKLLALAGFTLALMAMPAPWMAGLALLLVLALHLTGGPVLAQHALRALWPLWPFILVITIWHLWTGEIHSGALILLRMLAAVAAANLVTMTTRLSEMLAVFEWLSRPLAFLIPPRRLALAFAMVIRFVPRMAESMQLIRMAWRARSRRAPGWRVLLPTILAAIDDADHAAEALRARGGVD